MSTLPTLHDLQYSPSGPRSPLAVALELLFEHSPILIEVLEPQLAISLKTMPLLSSYTELIDLALAEIAKWDVHLQAQFIAGHPRIGETKNLSALSSAEQGSKGSTPTPPEVLGRLVHLNACYEAMYPGLRYITFVNGRSRAMIAEEMEEVLQTSHSFSTSEPTIDSIIPKELAGQEWRSELQRAVRDIASIAKSRLGAFGLA